MTSLSLNHDCLPRSSNFGLAVNVVLSLAFGLMMPRYIENMTDSEKLRAPFMFKQFRLFVLSLSLFYNTGRLIYESTLNDVAVVLLIARFASTMIQLIDHAWLCNNWAVFFLKGEIRAFLW